MTEIPYYKKYMMTIREAAEYFHLGEKTLRQIVESAPDAKYLMRHGNRIMIKRKAFEKFLNKKTEI